MRRVAAIPALALAVAVAACDGGRPPSRSGAPSSGGPRGTTGVDPAMTVAPSPSATPDPAAPAVIDPTLLGYLPETVGAAPVTEAIDEAAAALAEPELSEIGTAIDVGVALDEATGNLVAAHVVRLREGAFDDETFRQWRDSFDDGACAAAGGVVGRAETMLDERTVFVTSCVAQLRTYHVWIEDENLLISAASVGDGGFGELLMSTLRVDA